MAFSLRLVLGAALPLVLGSAIGAQAKPEAVIDSPFAGSVFRASLDASGRVAVVSNTDNAVTIWDDLIRDGPTRFRTARVPLRREQNRPERPVALSPDASVIALGVPPELDEADKPRPNSTVIYILNRPGPTKIVHRIESDLPSVPQALKFSPDGKYLAALLSAGCGVRVWSTETWKLWAKDDVGYGENGNCTRQDPSIQSDSGSLEFLDGSNGRPWLLTTGRTGLRAYDHADSGIILRGRALPVDLDLERPAGVASSPDGAFVVVGDSRDRQRRGRKRFRVAIVDLKTLKTVRTLEIGNDILHTPALAVDPGPHIGQFSLDRVAWVRRGEREFIFAAGAFHCRVKPKYLHDVARNLDLCMVRWERGGGDPLFIPVGPARVADLLPLTQPMGQSKGLFVVTQSSIKLVDIEGALTRDQPDYEAALENTAADFRGANVKRLQFSISADGRIVSLEDYRHLKDDKKLISFDLDGLGGNDPSRPTARAKLSDRAIIPPDQDKKFVDQWENNTESRPVIDGKELGPEGFEADEVHRSAAVLKPLQLVLLGSSRFLRLVTYEEAKPRVLCRQPVRSPAYRVNVTPKPTPDAGYLAVVAHGDGTLRWYRLNLKDDLTCRFELVLSVYLKEVNHEWQAAAWVPNGEFYFPGEDIIDLEWQVGNNGDFVQFKDERVRSYDRPDLVKLAFARGDAHGHPADGCFETIRDLTPGEKIGQGGSKVRLKVEIGNLNRCSAEKRIDVRLADDTGIEKTFAGKTYGADDVIPFDTSQGSVLDFEIQVPEKVRTQQGDFQICFSFGQEPNPANCLIRTWTGALAPKRPKRLWGVIVGIAGNSADPRLALRFAANDALDVARLFVDDHRRRKSSPLTDDYQSVRFNLVVSPRDDDGRGELDRFADANRDNIKVFKPTVAGIVEAFEDIRTEMQQSASSEDVFLFWFSGHGGANGKNDDRGELLLGTTETRRNALESTTFGSRALISELVRIGGQKVVVLDACRSLPPEGAEVFFDPSRAEHDLSPIRGSTHRFYSGSLGQESLETPFLFYDSKRDPKYRGNSVFTYAFLRTLAGGTGSNRVTFLGLAAKIEDAFVGQGEPASVSAELITAAKNEHWPVLQQPTYNKPAKSFSNKLFRLLDAK